MNCYVARLVSERTISSSYIFPSFFFFFFSFLIFSLTEHLDRKRPVKLDTNQEQGESADHQMAVMCVSRASGLGREGDTERGTCCLRHSAPDVEIRCFLK